MSAFLVALVINIHYLFTGGGSTVVTRTHVGQTVNYWYFHCVYNTIIMHAYLSLSFAFAFIVFRLLSSTSNTYERISTEDHIGDLDEICQLNRLQRSQAASRPTL